jgi:hypothetical protein
MTDQQAPLRRDRLADWWSQLSAAQRQEAYSLQTSSPMPHWMVRSLVEANIPGLVELPSRGGRPQFLMPSPVVQLVARCRRGAFHV